MFLRIVALLCLDCHKGSAVEALVAGLHREGLVGHDGLRAGLGDGHRARHDDGHPEDQEDQSADPFLVSLLEISNNDKYL